jgi:hypothetical protein
LESTATAQIFLEHGGFKTWIAHFLATKSNSRRKLRTRTLIAFDQLPANVRINAAKTVANVQPHLTTDAAICKIYETLLKTSK